MNATMWESVPVRELPTIPEFDYYNTEAEASSEDEDLLSSRHHHHNHLEAASKASADAGLPLASETSLAVHCSATAKLLARLSNNDLAFEWSMLCQDCTDCWSQHGKPNR